MKNEFPFHQTVEDNLLIRTFYESVDEMDLIWHQDEHDRIIEVLDGVDWKIQFDNKLPIKLSRGNKLFIPSLVYHRIIKGKGNLIIKIEEFMITCVCTNTSETTIKEILSQDNGKQLLEDMGVGQCCGSCIDDLNDLLENNLIEGESND